MTRSPSRRAVWTQACASPALRPASSDVAPDAIASYARSVVPLERYVEGSDKVKVTVRPVVR